MNFSSRDVIFHIADKAALLSNFHACLKDGGYLLLTDFCCGDTPFSQDLIDYSRSGIYTLTPIHDYIEVIKKRGVASAL